MFWDGVKQSGNLYYIASWAERMKKEKTRYTCDANKAAML